MTASQNHKNLIRYTHLPSPHTTIQSLSWCTHQIKPYIRTPLILKPKAARYIYPMHSEVRHIVSNQLTPLQTSSPLLFTRRYHSATISTGCRPEGQTHPMHDSLSGPFTLASAHIPPAQGPGKGRTTALSSARYHRAMLQEPAIGRSYFWSETAKMLFIVRQ